MKIMLVTGKYPPQQCGIGDHVHRLVSELSGYGHDVSVVASSRPEGSIFDYLSKHKTEIVHIHYQPDLYGRHPMITLLPILLRRKSSGYRMKTVVTLHELTGPHVPFFTGPLRRAWVLVLAASSDGVIVTNERDFSLLHKVPGFSKKLHYIPFAPTIDARHFPEADRQAVRKRLGVAEEEILIVRFGFIHNLKTNYIQELIQAVKILYDKGYLVKLMLVGGEEKKGCAEITTFARALKLEGRVILTGYCSCDEVSQYLAGGDIAVQCYAEGVCEKRTGLLAAMVHGLPVVSCGRGHVASMFKHRENIMLAASASPDCMSRAIEELIVNKDLRMTLGRNAGKIRAGFNWDLAAKKINELYGSLTGNSNSQT